MQYQVSHFQRDELDDSVELHQRIEHNFILLAQSDIPGSLDLLGKLSEDCRLAGRYVEALALLTKAVNLAQQLDEKHSEIVNLLRLATTQQYLNQHLIAEPLFREALDKIILYNETEFEDFALEHLGKCLVEMGQVDDALNCFRRALEIRQKKGDVGLIESTTKALIAAEALKNQN
jgi:tetratricopeptide (TPR) repeat protein